MNEETIRLWYRRKSEYDSEEHSTRELHGFCAGRMTTLLRAQLGKPEDISYVNRPAGVDRNESALAYGFFSDGFTRGAVCFTLQVHTLDERIKQKSVQDF